MTVSRWATDSKASDSILVIVNDTFYLRSDFDPFRQQSYLYPPGPLFTIYLHHSRHHSARHLLLKQKPQKQKRDFVFSKKPKATRGKFTSYFCEWSSEERRKDLIFFFFIYFFPLRLETIAEDIKWASSNNCFFCESHFSPRVFFFFLVF